MGLYVKRVRRKKGKTDYYLTDGSRSGGKSVSRLIRRLTREEIDRFENEGSLETQGVIIENPRFKPHADSQSKARENPPSTLENKNDIPSPTAAVRETPGRAIEAASEPPSQLEVKAESTQGKGEPATRKGETKIQTTTEIREHPLKPPPLEKAKIPTIEKKEPAKIHWPVGIPGLKLTSLTHKIIDAGGGFYELEPKLLGSERGHVLVAKDGEVYCGTCRLRRGWSGCEHTQTIKSAMRSAGLSTFNHSP